GGDQGRLERRAGRHVPGAGLGLTGAPARGTALRARTAEGPASREGRPAPCARPVGRSPRVSAAGPVTGRGRTSPARSTRPALPRAEPSTTPGTRDGRSGSPRSWTRGRGDRADPPGTWG